MEVLVEVIIWLNSVANAVGRVLLAPIGVMPGWLSATLVAVVCGVVFLAIFKYTSFQHSIKRVRNYIKANLLALKLFKDSALVALQAQRNIFVGVILSVLLAVVPVSFLLGQLALWYQARPLRVGEEAVVTMKLHESDDPVRTDVRLLPSDAMDVTIGPVRVASKREICWNIRARQNGHHRLVFAV